MSVFPAVRIRRAVAAGALVLLASLIPAMAASAHAELLSTDPADGSVVAKAPDVVTMQFSENVSLRPDGVRVLDAQGKRVDSGAASASGADVSVPLQGGLADGTYVVAWRVVSADGHPVYSSFTFSIGQESTLKAGVADKAFGSGNDRTYQQLDAVLRALAYIGTLGAAGYVLIGSALRRDGDPSPVGRGTTIASVIALLAILLQVPLQGALATGRGLGAIGEAAVLKLSIADGMGWAALVVGVGLLAIIITSGLPWEGAARKVALAGAVIAPVGFVLTGHTRVMSPAVVGYLADLAHVGAAAVWFGGLVAVIYAVRRRRAEEDPLGAAEAVATFSGWAAITASVLIVAGVVLGWIEVGGLKALTTTLYGRLLLAKVAAVLVILAAAGWNRYRLVPRVAAAAIEDPPAEDRRAWTTLMRLIRLEVGLIVVVLMLTSVLANVTPAKDAVDKGPISVTAPLGDGTVNVIVDPSKVGRNDIHAYILKAGGGPDSRYKTAEMSLSLPSKDVGPLDRTPVSAGPGHFQLVATDLPLAGTWSLTITVKLDRFTEQEATVTFPVR
ncbi:copper resistance CopC/CopD family protein [Aquihabitans sp. McL0605]|uniref:copper resistance CopC/CopD family protein n=1 Tax=Aquihabitans sp. McL0605 TaxID=3415671 RepID=UPI003CF5F24F